MLQSIVDDIKAQFSHGNMITRIILVNVFLFFIVIIVKAFSPASSQAFETFRQYLVLSSDGWQVLKRPWVLITHMFYHEGIWHLGWNMILLYWFGRITGDLGGDRRVLPIYILGGLAGALAYFIYIQAAGISLSIAYGASAAVTCIIVVAACLAPEYIIRLFLIGDVRLKYIALALILIDIVMITEHDNMGGRFAHLGGAAMGGYFVYALRQGRDLSLLFRGISEFFNSIKTKKSKAPMTVVHNKKWPNRVSSDAPSRRTNDVQERIDQILDKINESGYESLTKEEKEFLYQASQSNS